MEILDDIDRSPASRLVGHKTGSRTTISLPYHAAGAPSSPHRRLPVVPKAETAKQGKERPMTDLIWSFAPWLVFLLATRVTSLYGAVAAGVVAGIIVLGRAIGRRQVHLLDIASLLYFIALGGVLWGVQPGHLDTWARYAQAGSHAALTLIVFGSILIRHPFTESYARETTPRELWHTPEFHAINRRISAMWGLAFPVGTVSLIIAGSVDYRQILLRVIVPFGALVLAFRYTQRQTSERPDPDGPRS
jgi:hypothetical protein